MSSYFSEPWERKEFRLIKIYIFSLNIAFLKTIVAFFINCLIKAFLHLNQTVIWRIVILLFKRKLYDIRQ